MKCDLVYRNNVEFEFYKAALNKEITAEAFFKAREIIKRAKSASKRSMTVMEKMASTLEQIGEGAEVISVSLDDAIKKLDAQSEGLEAKEAQ